MGELLLCNLERIRINDQVLEKEFQKSEIVLKANHTFGRIVFIMKVRDLPGHIYFQCNFKYGAKFECNLKGFADYSFISAQEQGLITLVRKFNVTTIIAGNREVAECIFCTNEPILVHALHVIVNRDGTAAKYSESLRQSSAPPPPSESPAPKHPEKMEPSWNPFKWILWWGRRLRRWMDKP
jgi:hypothetical protein